MEVSLLRAGLICFLLWGVGLSASARPGPVLWTFDDLSHIGGAVAHAEGHPKQILTRGGTAVVFNGKDDAIFVDSHPLAGAETFTFEAIFRPDGGAFAQRWFHLAEVDPKTGQETGTRFLFEIRVMGNRWYLDAFTKGPGYAMPLIMPDKTFPIGLWYHVAQTFDGHMYRSYVNGVLQAEAPIAFKAQGAGRSSVGVRLNRVNYFHGAILNARFTPRALRPDAFEKIPKGMNSQRLPAREIHGP